jgi:outer membrane protein assembly factor BamA
VWTVRKRLAFVSALRIGAQSPFGSTTDVPISERFFAGGSSTVRGFDTDLLGPLEDGLPTGGEGLLVLNGEVRFPLISALRGVAFYDAGNVDPLDLRHVLGAGFRLETPIGPLRVEYGWKLDRQTGEEPGQFFFSIGNAF